MNSNSPDWSRLCIFPECRSRSLRLCTQLPETPSAVVAQLKEDWRVYAAFTQHGAAIMPNVAYLAIVAAEAVATLGALGQCALVAAGPAFFGTLLKKDTDALI